MKYIRNSLPATERFPLGGRRLKKYRSIMSNSISNIQSADTNALQGIGEPKGNDGKHSVQTAFESFKGDLLTRSSKNALSTLHNIQYRKPAKLESGWKFFTTLGQKILDICHNFRVAMYSTSTPALDIGKPLEDLYRELSKPNNSSAIKNAFNSSNEGAKNYLRKMADNLAKLEGEIKEELEHYNRGKEGKRVLEESMDYIEKINKILVSTTTTEQIRYNWVKFGNKVTQGIKDMKKSVEGFANKIYEAGPTDKQIEDNFNKFSQSVQDGINKFEKNVEKFGKQVRGKIDNFFNQ